MRPLYLLFFIHLLWNKCIIVSSTDHTSVRLSKKYIYMRDWEVYSKSKPTNTTYFNLTNLFVYTHENVHQLIHQYSLSTNTHGLVVRILSRPVAEVTYVPSERWWTASIIWTFTLKVFLTSVTFVSNSIRFATLHQFRFLGLV